jgi:hypothetical protein
MLKSGVVSLSYPVFPIQTGRRAKKKKKEKEKKSERE